MQWLFDAIETVGRLVLIVKDVHDDHSRRGSDMSGQLPESSRPRKARCDSLRRRMAPAPLRRVRCSVSGLP